MLIMHQLDHQKEKKKAKEMIQNHYYTYYLKCVMQIFNGKTQRNKIKMR